MLAWVTSDVTSTTWPTDMANIRPAAPVFLVGEAPGGPTDVPPPSNHRPLYPRPTGCAGHRLFELTGYSMLEYVRGTTRENLIPDRNPSRWPVLEARDRADVLHERALVHGQLLVLLGARVSAAFGVTERPMFEPFAHMGVRTLRLPHPSGRNLAWNDAASRERARALFQEVLPDVRAYLSALRGPIA